MRRVFAVVPSFRPSAGLLESVGALRLQVERVIVVDDGSPGGSDVVDQLEREGIRVLRHERNQGIAAALNTGTRDALDAGADLVLTVDQDTRLPADYVAVCLRILERGERAGLRVGAVAAGSVNGGPILPYASVEGVGLMRYALQSGLLITAATFEACGLFDDRLVIDLVDTEFCLRIGLRGYLVVAGEGADIEHELGEPMPATIFGIRRMRGGVERSYEYHAPFRQYYITRNGLDVALRYLRSEPRWAAGSLRHDLGVFLTGFAAGPHRGKHLLASALGAAHAVRRRRGMLSDRWRERLSITA